jgi:RNA polymerase sigma-70 factor, ECF subfamily
MAKGRKKLKTHLMISDDELTEKARRGDSPAFRELVQRHEQQVRSTVIGMLGEGPDADDVAQEVFIRFYRSLNNFRGDAKVNTYLHRIAVNLSLNELKRRKTRRGRLISLNRENLPMQAEDPSAAPGRSDTRDLVQKALQELDPDFRSVAVLRLIDGYSVKETSEILQTPMGTVASRLARAQEKLKEVLEKWNAF